MRTVLGYGVPVSLAAEFVAPFPRSLTGYADAAGASLTDVLTGRLAAEPFNGVAAVVFAAAILHTFLAPRLMALAHQVQARHDEARATHDAPQKPSLLAESLHFLGEVEVVFGLWALVLMGAIAAYAGWGTARHYFNDGVNYTEALFVVVVMSLASTRPVLGFAEAGMRRLAGVGGATPAAWWATLLTVGPLLGSFITEPAAMTISALLLGRQFFDLMPSTRLRYATLGLLFVNISIGGTLTHFAAPPVLMVARPWDWGTGFMLQTFGLKAAAAIVVSTALYFLVFRRELVSLSQRTAVPDVEQVDEDAVGSGLLPVPAWLTAAHLVFLVWTVVNAHYPALFVGGFLFFLGFVRATAVYQSRLELRSPLLVGFFLAGLVIHGGLQGWWIEPVLGRLSRLPLFVGATLLTAFNDNALITYLATLVPHLDASLRVAVVGGAVVGGGLTVIANAPNPAGQAILNRFFDGAISPMGLLLGALPPTIVAGVLLLWL